MQVYLLGAILFFIALAIFVFQNNSLVTVHFLNWTSPDVSLAVVALIAACAGAMVTFMVDGFRYFKVAKRIKELTDMNKKLQSELKDLEKECRENKQVKLNPEEKLEEPSF
jgi:uncharacterized integral membrane protein